MLDENVSLVITDKYTYLGMIREGTLEGRIELFDCFVIGFDNEKLSLINKFNPSFLAIEAWVFSDLIKTISVRLADINQIVLLTDEHFKLLTIKLEARYGTGRA